MPKRARMDSEGSDLPAKTLKDAANSPENIPMQAGSVDAEVEQNIGGDGTFDTIIVPPLKGNEFRWV